MGGNLFNFVEDFMRYAYSTVDETVEEDSTWDLRQTIEEVDLDYLMV